MNNKKIMQNVDRFNTEDFTVDDMRKIRVALVLYDHTQRVNVQEIR